MPVLTGGGAGAGGGAIEISAAGRITIGTGGTLNANGGTAGGGAGGTVKIVGSVVEASGAVASAAGGGSSGNIAPGGDGRVVVGNNVASGAPTLGGGTTATFDGTRDVNPYIKATTLTPFIPDLADSAKMFGILAGVDANDSFYDFLRASAPDRAIGAFVQSNFGPAGYDDNYEGFDFFSFVNLTDNPLMAPRLGVDFADFSFFEPLKVGG